jgi:hypothetical protein
VSCASEKPIWNGRIAVVPVVSVVTVIWVSSG